METVNVVLTDEMKVKLRGALGFDVSATFKYVPLAFRSGGIDKAMWPVFVLKSKDGLEVAKSEDEAGYVELDNRNKLRLETGAQRVATLERGIVSVKNMLMESGDVVSYTTDSRTMKIQRADGSESVKNCDVRGLIRLMPAAMQTELQNVINERSTLTPEELSGLE